MEMRWVYGEKQNEELVNELSQALNIKPELAQILFQRGVTTFDQAKAFFRPSLTSLHDPFLMKDMEKAVNRLTDAVSSGEKILIYGDYDVDGTTSVALVYSFLNELGADVAFYIPDRYKEGYGISNIGVNWAADNGFTLMIALDCGITAIDQTNLANALNLDLIICDHHNPGAKLPEAIAVLDPKRKDCGYPFKELSGCGVGFKLLHGFCLQQTIDLNVLYRYLDLLAVSIASDIVQMTGENRILSYYGLKKINQSPSEGLKSLIEISGLKPPISISDVVFYIGPRINAAGRLAHASDSVKLLIAQTEEDTLGFAGQLNTRNTERRAFDQNITKEAIAMIASDEFLQTSMSTVLFKPDWHKGVVGIVASRCIEQYYRPTIILTESNGKATGSARSVEGFDVYTAISSCKEWLDQFGGHTHAAGLTMPVENIDNFRKAFEAEVKSKLKEEHLSPRLPIDLEVTFDFINFKALSILDQMAPFGPGALQPTFVSTGVMAKNIKVIKEKHLKMVVYQENLDVELEAIGFGFGALGERLKRGEPFKFAFHIEENNFRGNKSIQLNIKDIKFD
ncbi:MAG: single-stranded-DNA-specific exonuclease RecJ [Cyclobacteriaceae bacterium]